MFDAIVKWYGSRERDPKTGIRNFGVVEPFKIYRGAAPDELENYLRLVGEYGIHTILDLRRERRASEYIRAAMEDLKTTIAVAGFSDNEPPNPKLVEACLTLLKDKTKYPIFVHCQGGRHRTGGIIAKLRVSRGECSPADARAEAREYGFYGFRHRPWEDFLNSL